MYFSIRGKISEITNKFLVIDANGIGYEIFVSKPSDYKVGEETYLYLHHHIKEDNEYLVGFASLEEKETFNLLLHVNGIGPKSALLILSHVEIHALLGAISMNDLDFIEQIPGISDRVASQILLDLKNYIAKNNRENVALYKEIKEALKALKFKVKDIDKVLPNVYVPNGTKEDIFKEALKRLSYAKNFG